jgi:hypothetical protein
VPLWISAADFGYCSLSQFYIGGRMPTLVIEYTTEAERLQYERMIAYVQEMNRLGLTAAHGTVLDRCEVFALDAGRKLLRDNLAAAVQARADAEKKSPARGRRAPSPAT